MSINTIKEILKATANFIGMGEKFSFGRNVVTYGAASVGFPVECLSRIVPPCSDDKSYKELADIVDQYLTRSGFTKTQISGGIIHYSDHCAIVIEYFDVSFLIWTISITDVNWQMELGEAKSEEEATVLNHVFPNSTFDSSVIFDQEFFREMTKVTEERKRSITIWKQGKASSPRITYTFGSGQTPKTEFYPWLNESIDSYYQRFIDSNEHLLILIGPPGTGKSTFIRGFIDHQKPSQAVHCDSDHMFHSEAFMNVFNYTPNTLHIFEDAAPLVSNVLNVGKLNNIPALLNYVDGTFNIGNKVIVSCNLRDINDLDERCRRAGRCFDVLYFGELSPDDAFLAAQAAGIVTDDNAEELKVIYGAKRQWPLADALYVLSHEKNKEAVNESKRSTFGFNQ